MNAMKIILNAGAILTSRLLSPIVRMGLIILLSRFLGKKGLGEFQIIVTYAIIFETLSGLGLWSLVTREVAKDKAKAFKYLLHGSFLGVFSVSILFVLMNFFSLGYSPSIRNGIFILSFSLIPSMTLVFSEAICIAFDHAKDIAILKLFENIMLVISCGLLLWRSYGLLAVLVCILTLRLFIAVIGSSLAFRLCPVVKWGFDWPFCRELLWHVPVFLGSALAWVLFSRVDILVLSRLVSVEEIGLYAAATRILTMCQEVPQSVLVAIFPLLSSVYPTSRLHFRELTQLVAKYLLIFTFPVIAGTIALAPNIINLVFDEQFLSSVPILKIAIWSFLPFGLMKLAGIVLIATNNQKIDLKINYVILIINFAVNVTFVHWYGILGASYALVVTASCAFLLRIMVLWWYVCTFSLDHRLVSALIATFCLWTVLEQVKHLPVVPVVLGSVPVYLLLLVMLKTFTREELVNLMGTQRWMDRPWIARFFPTPA